MLKLRHRSKADIHVNSDSHVFRREEHSFTSPMSNLVIKRQKVDLLKNVFVTVDTMHKLTAKINRKNVYNASTTVHYFCCCFYHYSSYRVFVRRATQI